MTKIKICGIFRKKDVEYVKEAMPDYVGFVFYPKSHRFVTDEMAALLKSQLSSKSIIVGVFVNEPIEHIVSLYKQKIIEVIQLHGGEDEVYIRKLCKLIPNTEIWKTYCIQTREDISNAKKSIADKVVLDYGLGEGKRFDWSLIEAMEKPIILAGGITLDTVKEAIKQVHPAIIDVSTGVERGKVKNKRLIQQMVEAVRKGVVEDEKR